MLRLIVAVLLCWFAYGVGSADAILIQNYTAAEHDRFTNDGAFIGNDFDFSGIGRLAPGQTPAGRWVTMISPSYFLSATHLHPGLSTTIHFYETNDMTGTPIERTVEFGERIDGSDLWLGKLSSPVGASIATYPILEPINLLDQLIYVVGQSGSTGMRVGRNSVDEVVPDFQINGPGSSEGDVIVFDYDTIDGLGADESLLQGGDSGGPSFTVVDGELALLGIHWFRYQNEDENGMITERGSGDTLVSSLITELESAMVGESLTIVAIPEPSAVFALGILALGMSLRITRSVT